MFSKYSKEQLHAAAEALRVYKEEPFIRHEWEELVSRLCRDNDPVLREKMTREMQIIVEKNPTFKNFGML
ncbi:MAG: hypothetical protein ACOYL3_09820 [Desulfuromonadaceae bacterium]